MVTTRPDADPSVTDFWGHATAKNGYLGFALCCVSVMALLAVGALIWQRVHGLDTHFIPPGGPSISHPGEIPDSLALEYAKQWTRLRFTFTPATIKDTHVAIKATLHPAQIVPFEVLAEKELRMIKEHKMSSQLVVSEATVTQREPLRVVVVVDGTRTVWLGSQLVREEPTRTELVIAPWYAAGMPMGIAPLRVTSTPPLSATGE